MEGSDGGWGTFHDARRSNEGLNPVATITASTPPMALASNSTLCVTSAKTLTHSTHMISESPNPSISQYPKKICSYNPCQGLQEIVKGLTNSRLSLLGRAAFAFCRSRTPART